MYCGKCGKFVEDGQSCSCEIQNNTIYGGENKNPLKKKEKGSVLKALLSLIALVLAVLAICFQFMDVYVTYRDFGIDDDDYEDYQEAAKEEDEDFEDGKISLGYGGYLDDGYYLPSYLNTLSIVAFAVYVGALLVRGKKAETVKRVAQGVFFCLMLMSVLLLGFSFLEVEEPCYAMPEPRYDSKYEDPNYGDYSWKTEVDLDDYYYDNHTYSSYYEETYLPIKEAGLDREYSHSYYMRCYDLAAGWYLSVAACALGLAVTAVSAFVGKKED